jgi:hypothetical protein
MADVIFSNRELTLRELIDAQLAVKGDMAAFCRFLVSRTGAEEERFMSMTMAEINELVPALNRSLVEAVNIGAIALSMVNTAGLATASGGE